MITPEFQTQYTALTAGVGFADLSDRTRLELRGRDRAAFLHSFCTNDVKGLAPGRGCEAFITGPQGKTLGHVQIFCQADRLVLDTSPGQAAALIAHFDKYLISEDVQFADRTADWGELLIAGAHAAQSLKQIIAAPQPTETRTSTRAMIAACEVVICKTDYAGPTSFFVQMPRPSLESVVAALTPGEAVRCEMDAVEAARLEAGFPLFGRDITDDNLPQEVGRDAQAISFTKGCYLGQETIARIDALGHVNRLLVGLRFSGSSIPAAGTAVLASDKEVGRVASSAWSPLLNAPLALGYVRRAHAVPGAKLASAAGDVEVVRLPVRGN